MSLFEGRVEMYSRQPQKQSINFKLRLLLLAINMILISLLFTIPVLQFLMYAGLGILGLLILLEIVTMNDYSKKFGQFRDYLKLSRKYSRINLKFSVVGIIGLVIAILIISQAIIVSTTYEQNALDDHLGAPDGELLHIQVNGLSQLAEVETWDTIFTDNIPQMGQDYNFNVTSIESDATFRVRFGMGQPQIVTDGPGAGNFFIEYLEGTLTSWTETWYQQLSLFPSWNVTEYGANDTIIVLPYRLPFELDSVEVNSTIQVLTGSDERTPGLNFSVYQLPVDHFWKPNQTDYQYYLNTSLLPETREIFKEPDSIFYFGNISHKWQTYNQIVNSPIEELDELQPPKTEVSSIIKATIPHLASESVEAYQTRIIQFSVYLQNWLSDSIEGDISTISPLSELLSEYTSKNSLSLSILSLLLAGPIIGLAIYLVYFSLNMAEQRKLKYVTIMKQRGMASRQLQDIMFIELLSLSLIAAIIGILLSVPFVIGLLDLIGGPALNFVTIWNYFPTSWIWRLPLICMIFAININMASLLRLSNFDLSEDLPETDEDKSGVINKIPIDVLVFLVSVTIWSVILFVPLSRNNVGNIITGVLGPVGLMSFFLSFPMIYTKIFSFTTTLSTSTIWKRYGNLFSLSLKNIDRHKPTAKKILAFLLLGLILMNTALILPASFDFWGEESARYETGAEVYIDGISSVNSDLWNQTRDLPGIDSLTEIRKMTIYGLEADKVFLAVDPSTFMQSAYWRNSFADDNLPELLDSISMERTMAIQSDVLDLLGLDIGHNYTFFLRTNHQLVIENTFKYFPNLVSELPEQDPSGNLFTDQIPILISIDTLSTIDRDGSRTNSGAYATIDPKLNITKLELDLQVMYNDDDISIETVQENKTQLFKTAINTIITATFSMMLILTMMIGITVQSYFAFLLIGERQKEIGILKALGIVRKQIIRVFLTEWLILFVFAIIGGALGGLFVSYGFMVVIQILNADSLIGPPVPLFVPFAKITIYALSFIVIGSLLFLVPIWRYANRNTKSILSAE